MHGQLAQGLLVRGVGAHHVGEPAVEVLDGALVRVDAEHLEAGLHQLEGDAAPEPAEAEHGHGRAGPAAAAAGGEQGTGVVSQ